MAKYINIFKDIANYIKIYQNINKYINQLGLKLESALLHGDGKLTGLLSILYSIGSKPLQIWDTQQTTTIYYELQQATKDGMAQVAQVTQVVAGQLTTMGGYSVYSKI